MSRSIIIELQNNLKEEQYKLEKVNDLIYRLDGLPELLSEFGFSANTIILQNSARHQLDYLKKLKADLESSINAYNARLEELKEPEAK